MSEQDTNNKISRIARLEAMCKTDADRLFLERYKLVLADIRAARVELTGAEAVNAEEERESGMTDAEREAEFADRLRLLVK